MIEEVTISNAYHEPGEALTHNGGEYTHITISYNISGDRSKADSNVDTAIANDDHLNKVSQVNTTLYWQKEIGRPEHSKDSLVEESKKILEKKLEEIFIGKDGLNGASVTAFCMVGNLRAFVFELS